MLDRLFISPCSFVCLRVFAGWWVCLFVCLFVGLPVCVFVCACLSDVSAFVFM